MWYIVERAMAEETLDLIRNFGRLTVHSTPSKARAALTEPPQRDEEATALALLIRTVQRSTQAEKNEAKTNAAVRSTAAIVGGAEQKSDDEMSDGGFFEE